MNYITLKNNNLCMKCILVDRLKLQGATETGLIQHHGKHIEKVLIIIHIYPLYHTHQWSSKTKHTNGNTNSECLCSKVL